MTVLDQFALAHHAITIAMATVQISGAHYQALERASEALHQLAAELGHSRRFSALAPRSNSG